MTTVESSSELQITKENDCRGEGIDRMSNLPDSILLHILSFLPTETTVQTITLVSQRYRYLWKDLQVFYFYYYGDKSFKRFSDFVNGVFTLRTSCHIRKMHLEVYVSHNDSFVVTDSVEIETWIRAAMGPYLEELSLYIDGICIPIVDIPSTLFNCTNLVSLSLQGTIPFERAKFFRTISFPSLKVLRLDINSMDSLDVPDSLEIIDPSDFLLMGLSGCPVLQTLEIIDLPDYIWGIYVPPSLKRFHFYFNGEGVCPYLLINAPDLQYLNITRIGEMFIYVVGNLQSVVEAYINVFSPLSESQSVNPLLNLLRDLCGVKKLELPCLTTESLWCAPVLDFPEFCYLLHLDITIPSFNSKFLLNMLEKCPMLQDLEVMRDDSDEGAPLGGKWELQSTKIPNCLVSHLTSIYIGRYREFQDELLEFAEYILLNGLILKTMFIDVEETLLHEHLEENTYILERKRIYDIPRGSPMCQIEFR